VKASLSRHVLEFAEASIVIERHTAVHTIIGNKNVGLAVAIVVKKASSRTEERSHLWCLGRDDDGARLESRLFRHIYKFDLNLCWHFLGRAHRLFHKRVFPLISVS